MMTDNKYEYEVTRRRVMWNGRMTQRFILVRRKIGSERWCRVPDTNSFDQRGRAELAYAHFQKKHGLREMGNER